MIFLIYLVLGIIFNLIGPLANHLRKEDKYALKTNIRRSWFYKYLLISLIRIFSTLTYPLFYFNYYVRKVKPIEPVIFEDKLNKGLVKRLRGIGEYNNTAPSSKTTDEKIIEIYRLICSSFRDQAELRNERIKSNCLNTIALKFFNVYEEFGEDFMKEHLEYELDKYLKEGLRPEYQRGISLF
jgi:hypothetical protein